MTPHHPAKRRRLNDALNKPFKSPLKTSSQAKTANESTSATASTTTTSQNTPTAKPNSQHPTSTTPAAAPQLQPQPSSTPPSINLPPNTTPSTHLHTLQRKHTTLLTNLATTRTHLESSTQALQILRTPDRDAELARLTQKWKTAAQAAAEEVFKGARDRVNKMGGVRGLKERERERVRREQERGMEDGGGGGGSWGYGGGNGGEEGEGEVEEEEDEKEGVGDREERLEREQAFGGEESEYDRAAMRQEGGEVDEVDEVDEEAGYTMDMMLKTMNIDLDVIRYDKYLQRWAD